MASTTFSGPVTSLNGFIGGTAAAPISVSTAGNINSSYATTSAATGDTRLSYEQAGLHLDRLGRDASARSRL
jgi:hypothetical protein